MVEVYARAAKVALKINGKTVGEAAPKNDCVVRFSCTYEDGTVEAVSYDAAGNEIGRTALHTANTETRLCLVPEEETVRLAGWRLSSCDTPMKRHGEAAGARHCYR